MFLHRIQTRLIFLFVGFSMAVMAVGGWTLHWMIRQNLESELGKKLEAVAGAASVQFVEEEIGYLIHDSGPRVYEYLRQRLLQFREKTDIKRVYFFDEAGNNLLDTEDDAQPGTVNFRLQFHRKEMDKIREGKSSHSVLFKGIDKLPTMTGYVPLFLKGRVIGGVGVDGSASFLGAVETVRNRLYLIGLIGTFAASVLGVLIAKTITRPIKQLAEASRRIGMGKYDESIPQQGQSEIGLLAKTMEEMRKGVIDRERELKAMLASVAHEIRNPLGGMELFIGLLTDELQGERNTRAHIDKIRSEMIHLKEIVDHFLEFAKPREPRMELCRIGEMIEEIRLLTERERNRHHVDLIFSGDQDLKILVDPGHLRQILLNLIRNSVQAMPRGGKVQIRCEQTDNRVTLFLRDTGEGIPPDIQEKIFTPFFTTREKGTGLGLPIVKGLVESNKGTIQLIRSSSNGTEFAVTFIKK